MKTKIIILILITFSWLLACGKQYPYKFIESKTENFGANNTMELYYYSGEMNIDTLKKFCIEKKKDSNSKMFYFAVIFDDESSAAFPINPFTASYDTEEYRCKHIRAIYTYNKVNGFSELTYYEKNKFESVAKSEAI